MTNLKIKRGSGLVALLLTIAMIASVLILVPQSNTAYAMDLEANILLPTDKPVYRLYNPVSGLHHYTGVLDEKETLLTQGWQFEGEQIRVGIVGNGGAPVYRLYHPQSGNHHWTKSKAEVAEVLATGQWNDEGIAWYEPVGSSPTVYRGFNPTNGDHFYTFSKAEMLQAAKDGLRYEKVAWGNPDPADLIAEIPAGQENSQSAAYLAIIKILAKNILGTGPYFTFDMANINVDKPDQLIQMVKNHCINNGKTFSINNGKTFSYAPEDMGKQTDEFAIKFVSSSFAGGKLTAWAQIWGGFQNMYAGSFTVTNDGNGWVATQTTIEMT